jgi:hypothetical protein
MGEAKTSNMTAEHPDTSNMRVERMQPWDQQLEPHTFEPFVDMPGWCRFCPLAREHRIHTQKEGEQP